MSKSRPILMSAPMVLATLGDLKTQTRRMVKNEMPPGKDKFFAWFGGELRNAPNGCAPDGLWATGPSGIGHVARSRYGVPGDELWVKETHQYFTRYGERGELLDYWEERCEGDRPDYIEYLATCKDGEHPAHWRPSIHLHRWASRLTLRVLSVRVERLQDISEADAIAEGIRAFTKDGVIMKYAPAYRHSSGELEAAKGWAWQDMPRSAVDAYARLWDIINGDGAWASNPWVWRIEYERVKAGA